MARHNHPEQTVEKILEVSQRLFMEKGYEKTTIQDIIDAVGMSKGVIYYHFKSKEEVFDAVMAKQFSQTNVFFTELITNTKASNSREKIIKTLDIISSKSSLDEMDPVLLAQAKNPQFILAGMHEAIRQDAPVFSKLIQEGVIDGSIKTNNPLEVAEMLLILLNIWCNPILFDRTESETRKRLQFLQTLMRLLGVDVISDNAIEKLLEGYQGGYKEKER
ncbi:TetR/AcrR family transcriptional repressor of nem operon [Lachnospiraceae bacterium PF1-22]|uniref:TetR/AcrR family transcriptional regulator n=1 Tax=Ohessyouella blattaphilus TaxID=2949333 RepID=UPI003E21EB69